jgi:hypothetical protein
MLLMATSLLSGCSNDKQESFAKRQLTLTREITKIFKAIKDEDDVGNAVEQLEKLAEKFEQLNTEFKVYQDNLADQYGEPFENEVKEIDDCWETCAQKIDLDDLGEVMEQISKEMGDSPLSHYFKY